MTTVSTADRDLYLDSNHVELSDVLLNVMPLVEVAQAVVTDTPVYPMASLAIGSTVSWGEALPGRLFSIERASGGEFVTWGVVRKTPTSSTFYPDVKSAGDYGYATHKAIRVATGDIVRVYSARPVWALLSRVDDTITQFKSWDIAYSEEGLRPYPVVNMGPHRAGFVDDRGYLRLELDGSRSYDWDYGTAGISGYLWTLPAGSIIVSGADTDAMLTVDIPPGLGLEISLTVSSLNGRASTGYRYVWANVNDPDSDYAPFNYKYPLTAIQDAQQVEGRQMTFTISGDLTDVVYPGMMALFTYRVKYDGQALDDAVTVNNFAGYLETVDPSGDYQQWTGAFTFLGPLKMLKTLPAATQLIEEAANPDDWQEVRVGLCDPAFAFFYIVKNHTTALNLYDFTYGPSMRLLRRPGFAFPQVSLYPQLNFLAEVSTGYVGARSDGSLVLDFIPDLLSQDDPTRGDYNQFFDRDAIDVKFDWDDRSIVGPLRINPILRPPVSEVRLNAVAYSGEADPPLFGSKAPGYHVAQGIAKQDLPDVTVTAFGRDLDLYRISGHLFAMLNNPLQSVSLDVFASLDLFEPADQDWHRLTVDPAYLGFNPNKFGMKLDSLNRVRFRPESVNRQWQQRGPGWIMKVTSNIRFESSGQPGVYWPIERDGASWFVDYDGWLPNNDFDLPDITVDLGLDLDFNTAITYNDFGFGAMTFNWLDLNQVNWGFLGVGLTGGPIDMAWILDTGAVDLFVMVYIEASNLFRLYKTDDVETALPAFTSQFSMVADEDTGKNARIVTSADGIYLAAWGRLVEGVYIYRTTTGLFGSSEAVGNGIGELVEHPIAVTLEGGDIYIGAYTTLTGWQIYKATGLGPFSILPNHPGDAGASTSQIRGLWSNSSYIFTHYDLDANLPGSGYVPDGSTYATGDISSQDDPTTPRVKYNRTIYQLGYPSFGVTFDIVEIDARASVGQSYLPGDSSGPSWLPPSTSDYDIDMTFRVILYDRAGRALATFEKPFNPGTGFNCTGVNQYFPAVGGFDRITRVSTVTINEIVSPSIDYVHSYFIEVTTNEPVSFTSPGWVYSPLYSIFGCNAGSDSDTLIYDAYHSEGNKFYRLDHAGATWDDITPNGNRYPARPNSLVVDGNNLYMIATDEDTGKRYIMTSTDNGSTWSEVKEVNYIWLKRLASGKFVLGGYNDLAVTIDSFSTFSSRLGDFGDAVTNPETLLDLLTKGEL